MIEMKGINIRKETRDRLIEISKRGQNYDDIITFLLDRYSSLIEGKIRKGKYSTTYTMILIRQETRERLKLLGNKSNSYDDVINTLIDMYLYDMKIKERGEKNDTNQFG